MWWLTFHHKEANCDSEILWLDMTRDNLVNERILWFKCIKSRQTEYLGGHDSGHTLPQTIVTSTAR